MAEHARLSPSGAEKWMACPGSVAMEAGEPDSSNDYSDEGTAAHHLAAECLKAQMDASMFIGTEILVCGGKAYWAYDKPADAVPSNVFTVDDDMCRYIQIYLDKVREYAVSGMLLVEQRMSISHITGEDDACGTADAVIVREDEIIVIDLKYGMREVDGDRNKQLMIYALAALKENELLGDFSTVRTVIVQPRIGHYPEWSCTVDELEEFGKEVHQAAHYSLAVAASNVVDADLRPGPHCQKNYCKARATCPALAQFVTDSIGADFIALDQAKETGQLVDIGDEDPEGLGAKMSAIPMIEDWCKAVRAKVGAKLFAGEPVPGYKLVQGKKGNRAWSDKTEAEAMMKGFKMKVEEMYDLKLISPTAAEKLAKDKVIGPRQWPKLSGYITQSEGSPSVAPESDKRPALEIKPAGDEFEDLTQKEADFADMI